MGVADRDSVDPAGRARSRDVWALLALGACVVWFFAPLLLGQAIVAEPDALAALLPLKAFLARAFATGEWPLWNPNAVLGKPYLSDLLAGALYPGNLFLAVPPFARGLNLLFVAHYAFTALGAFLWLRVVGLPRAAATLGALVWTFGGTMVSMGNVLNQLLSAAWLPWILWAWLRPHALGMKIALASLAMGLALLAGGPEMVLVSAAALVVTSRHPASLVVPPLAFAVAAVEILPFFRFLTETWRGVHGFAASDAMRYSVPPIDLVQLARDAWTPSPERFMPQIYVGPGVLLLALLGLATTPRARVLWVVVTIGALLVVMGSYTPVYPFLYAHLPMSKLLRYPEKLFLGVHALIAAGAATGAASLVAWLARRGGSAFATRASAALAVLLCVLVFGDLARANRDALFAPRPEIVLDPPASARAILADAQAAAPSDAGAAGAAAAPRQAPRVFSNPVGRPAARSLPAAVALDRALPWGAVGELYGLANVNAPSSLNLVKHEWLQGLLEGTSRTTALGALAALGTRYVTSWSKIDGVPNAVRLPIPDERIGVKLYRLADAQPRAFVATRVREARDARDALERFVAGEDGSHAGLALVRRGDVPASALASDGASSNLDPTRDAGARPRIVEDRGHLLVVEASMTTPGLLVVNDTMLDGWTARVDGIATPLVEVNGLVRGVWLDAGEHRVEMRYVPPGLLAGAGITAGTLLVLAALAWHACRRVRHAATSGLARTPLLARAGR